MLEASARDRRIFKSCNLDHTKWEILAEDNYCSSRGPKKRRVPAAE